MAETTDYQFLEQLRRFDGSRSSYGLLAPDIRWQRGLRSLNGRTIVAEVLLCELDRFSAHCELTKLKRRIVSHSVIRWEGQLQNAIERIGFSLLLRKSDSPVVWQLLEISSDPASERREFSEIMPDCLPVAVLRCEMTWPFRLLSANAAFYSLLKSSADSEAGCSELSSVWAAGTGCPAVFNNSGWLAQFEDEEALTVWLESDRQQAELKLKRRPVWLLAQKQCSDAAAAHVLTIVFINFSVQRHVREELKDQVYLRQTALSQTTDVLLEWERDTDRLRWISGGTSWLRIPRIAEHITDKIRTSKCMDSESAERLRQLVNQLRKDKSTAEAEFQLRIQGQPRWFRIRLSAADERTPGADRRKKPARILCVLHDIDQKKRRALRLQERAERDFLTGLYNKGTFQRQMQEVLHKDQEAGIRDALVVLDVDDFKQINDQLGHYRGDLFLSRFGKTLHQLIQKDNIAGRIGGDEFAVLLRHVETRREAERQAGKMMGALSQLAQHHSQIRISCSLGIALSGGAEESFAELYVRADQALYQAKRSGKCCCVIAGSGQ